MKLKPLFPAVLASAPRNGVSMINPDLELAIAILAVENGLISETTAERIIVEGRADRAGAAQALRDEVSETDLLRAVAGHLGIRFYDLYSQNQELIVDTEVFERSDIDTLRRYGALPLVDRRTGHVVVAMTHPDADLQRYLDRIYETPRLVLTPGYQIQDRLAVLGAETADVVELSAPRRLMPTRATQIPATVGPANPVLELVDSLLATAVAVGASDLHVRLDQNQKVLVWFRVDGRRQRQRITVPAGRDMEVIGALLSRCDTIDASNLREPQDGTFSFVAAGRQIDARLAMLPQTDARPAVVIRLLDSRNLHTRLDDMGFTTQDLVTMRRAASSSQGTVLVTGPTGSGKSTTLYGLLRELDHEEKNILTVEDPVEYRLPGIVQTQVRAGLGDRSVTFARSLRAILRMDPDIIMVGEIRDTETAKVTMDAAITGHLVFSTIHAPSALGVFTRLVEMGIPGYLPAEAVTLIVSQRLVRKLHDCSRLDPPSTDEVRWFEAFGLEAPERVARPVGCTGCGGTGYRGRLAVVELVEPGPELRQAVLNQSSLDRLAEIAEREGFRPILKNGVDKVIRQLTTVSELNRILVG